MKNRTTFLLLLGIMLTAHVATAQRGTTPPLGQITADVVKKDTGLVVVQMDAQGRVTEQPITVDELRTLLNDELAQYRKEVTERDQLAELIQRNKQLDQRAERVMGLDKLLKRAEVLDPKPKPEKPKADIGEAKPETPAEQPPPAAKPVEKEKSGGG